MENPEYRLVLFLYIPALVMPSPLYHNEGIICQPSRQKAMTLYILIVRCRDKYYQSKCLIKLVLGVLQVKLTKRSLHKVGRKYGGTPLQANSRNLSAI